MANVTEMLTINLCTFSYLNTGSLYKNIDCSKIFDGVMNKGLSETYVLFDQGIKVNGGIRMKDFNTKFRPKATYPLWM